MAGESTPYNGVRAFVDAEDTFAAMDEAFRTVHTSNHFIYILAWWMDLKVILGVHQGIPTSLGYRLGAAGYAGAQVRVMLYRNPSHHEGLAWIPPKTAEILDDLPDGLGVVDGFTICAFGAHHQKLVIVNGSQGPIAFCGGIDINNDRITVVKKGLGQPLHDVHTEIRGPAVQAFVEQFIYRWVQHPDTAELEKRPGKRPLLAMSRPLPASQMLDGRVHVRALETYNIVQSSRVSFRTFRRPGCKQQRTVRDALVAAFQTAERFIYIEDQYLVNLHAAAELAKALQRNAQLYVLCVIAASEISDLPQKWRRRADFIKLIQNAGVGDRLHVYHLVDRDTEQVDGTHTYVHAKMSLVDDEVAIIGSPNMNERGWSSDNESAVAILDPENTGPNGRSIVKDLRIRLWCEHLGCDASQVDDPSWSNVKAVWETFAPPSKARPYILNAGQDSDISTVAIDTLATLMNPSPEEHAALALLDEDALWRRAIDPYIDDEVQACQFFNR